MKNFYSLFIVCIGYSLAIGCAGLYVWYSKNDGDLSQLLYADIIATIVIYLFSYYFNNSSIYDPYWSVIPPFILIYFWYYSDNANIIIGSLLMFSVLFWSIRLTYNWIRSWKGLSHEDWRYVDMRKASKNNFQLSNFFGIHFFPTIIVFICCIPMKYALINDSITVHFIAGFVVCFIGVCYEIISDQQLYKFKKKNREKIINKGLWKYSRHPNYYGEILFWWGLFIYGLLSINYLWLILAPICMTLMFLFVSIPWIENKIIKTRPEYTEYQKKVSILFPEITFLKKIIS